MNFGHLKEYETESLVRELASRFDHFIMAGRKDVTENNYDILCEWSGDLIMCKGLAVEIRDSIGSVCCE
jgi:hypothetical protein